VEERLCAGLVDSEQSDYDRVFLVGDLVAMGHWHPGDYAVADVILGRSYRLTRDGVRVIRLTPASYPPKYAP
jgi:hypothetical protein